MNESIAVDPDHGQSTERAGKVVHIHVNGQKDCDMLHVKQPANHLGTFTHSSSRMSSEASSTAGAVDPDYS